jgi:hypothetical protein
MGPAFVPADATAANKLLADAVALGAEATQTGDHALYSRFSNLHNTVQPRLNAGRFVSGSILEGRTKTSWSRLPSSARRKPVSWPTSLPVIQALTPAELAQFTTTLRAAQQKIIDHNECMALRETAKGIRAAMSTNDDMKRYFGTQRELLADLMAILKTSSPTKDVRLPQSVVHVLCASKLIKLGEAKLQEARNAWHAAYPQGPPLGY